MRPRAGLPPRLLEIEISMPDKLYIGERGAVVAEIAAPRYRRSADFELIAEQRGQVERSEIVSARLAAGKKRGSRCRSCRGAAVA